MLSYQINIQSDEIFIEYEPSHNSLKLLHPMLVNIGDTVDIHIMPRLYHHSPEAHFLLVLCYTYVLQNCGNFLDRKRQSVQIIKLRCNIEVCKDLKHRGLRMATSMPLKP